MALIVQKFGGTSLGNTQRIKKVAELIRFEINKGSSVIAVVSAMAGVTDGLMQLIKDVSSIQNPAELHSKEMAPIIASGEIITSGLVSIALQEIGISAKSYQAWQLPISAYGNPLHSKIAKINAQSLLDDMLMNEIPIICGFQAINNNKIATLGRGGSDTTAVAIAAAVNADRCDIYTDVDGVYTCDPNFISSAKCIESLDYNVMISMAYSGAKVLHPRSVEIAKKYNIPIKVLSTLNPQRKGTIIHSQEIEMEDTKVVSINSKKHISLFVVKPKKDIPALIEEFDNLSDEIRIENFFFMNAQQYIAISTNESQSKSMQLFDSIEICESYHNVWRISICGYFLKSDNRILQTIFNLIHSKSVKLILPVINDIDFNFFVTGEVAELMHDLHKEFIK